MSIKELEQRVAALEAAVARLQANGPVDMSDPKWILSTPGPFGDDPGFAEAVRLGREWRMSQHPDAKKKKRAAKKPATGKARRVRP